MAKKIFLNQQDNVRANFGEVFRSAASFYYRWSDNFRTQITIFNYWKIKNNLDVQVVASLRHMDGELIRREPIAFDKGLVVNYSPVQEDFEGSVEIEIFSGRNMRYPYPAIMVEYETPSSVTMVHSYGRTYSPHEVEEQRTIPLGRESCWTLRDDDDTFSFGVFHNGYVAFPAQDVQMTVRRESDGQTKDCTISLPELKPYETVKIIPSENISGLAEFLQGGLGNCTLSFELGHAFTRLLVGNERPKTHEYQVTHSNFNYSEIQTDFLAAESSTAVYIPPRLDMAGLNVIVYPDSTQGQYTARTECQSFDFETGQIQKVPATDGTLNFTRRDGEFPSRLVLGLEMQPKDGILPAECSLNIFHKNVGNKRFHWGPCLSNKDHSSKLVITNMKELFGEAPADKEMVLRLYSTSSHDYKEARFKGSDIARFSAGVDVTEIFEGYDEFTGGEMAWWSIFFEHNGLLPYVQMSNESGSVCMEHGF